ncbi:MAG: hypothetical protein ABIH42_05635 [Planctomycetota bacterium]
MSKYLTLAAISVICICNGCISLGQEKIVSVDKETNYSIYPPYGWSFDNLSDEYPNMKRFVSPKIRGEYYRPFLNIVVESTNIGAEEYVEKHKAEVLASVEGCELVEETAVEIGSRWQLVYKMEDVDTHERLISCENYIFDKNKVYIITFTSTSVQWERLKELFFYSFETFKINYKEPEVLDSKSVSPSRYSA